MGRDGETWTTIESDPGVFTELIQRIGVKGVQVEELWSLDIESLNQLKPVFGLIFLFKWQKETDGRAAAMDVDDSTVFFANQVINNACATQAILAILLNCPHLELGQELSMFKEFTAGFTPEMKGLAISNSDIIRQVHNSFARPEPLLPDDDKDDDKQGEAFHFISYVAVGGTLYELDGLKPGPIALCTCSDDDWLEKVGPHIQSRMERYAASEIRFNLMALIGDRVDLYARRLAAAQQLRDAALARLAAPDAAAASPSSSGSGAELPGEPEALHARVGQLEQEIAGLQDALYVERAKHQAWRDENIRRKHNYVPFLFNFLKLMAQHGQLAPLIASARKAKS